MAIEKAKAGGGMRPSERRAQQMQQQGGYGEQPNGAAPYESRGGGRGGYQDYGNTRARPEPAGQYGYELYSAVNSFPDLECLLFVIRQSLRLCNAARCKFDMCE